MRHHEIQQLFDNHVYLAFRNKGSSKRLVGKIGVITVFVSDSHNHWSALDRARFQENLHSGLYKLMRAASCKQIPLSFSCDFIEATMSMNCTLDNRSEWSNQCIYQHTGIWESLFNFQRRYKERHQLDETVVLFVLEKPFRSAASPTTWPCMAEYCILSSDDNSYVIMHEMLHLFGAVDLYYPRAVVDYLTRTGYVSIMKDYLSEKIDSLTAYLIGWTDEIDAQAVQLLQQTKHYTQDMLSEFIRDERG